MKRSKKVCICMLTFCMLLFTLITNTYAATHLEAIPLETNKTSEIPIVFFTEKEMNDLIHDQEKTRINLFEDYIGVSVSRDPENPNRAFVVLMNIGFPLDVVDSVHGFITFYNSRGLIVANHEVNEQRLVYHVPRTDPVTAKGFTKISYTLTVTDGGTSTINRGKDIRIP